jgi:hypothetical protein
MQLPTSFSDFITDWERLITAVTNNEANLPELDLQRNSLEYILQEAKDLGARQDASRSQLAADSKRRREVIFEGRASVGARPSLLSASGTRRAAADPPTPASSAAKLLKTKRILKWR